MARAETTPLPLLLQQTQFITYTPRSFKVMGATITAATEAGIRDDLRVLKPLFSGLITYSSVNGQERIPAIAQELGFQAIIIGVWDPRSRVEIANAIRVAKRYPGLVAAVVVGNEGIFTKRYRPEDVKQAMARIKGECPTLAVTTSEPFALYFQKEYADFFQAHDLLMPNVHPVFEPWFKPEEPGQGVMMVVNVAAQFKESYHLPLLIKETGMPSGPPDRAGYSESRQALFWSELSRRFPFAPFRAIACFEAFDAPWKPAAMAADFPGDHASEAFWGFFTATGKAKEVVNAVNRRQKFLRPAGALDQSR
jgi:exo-beta-1,3-glucanase (GH17 family)